MNYPTEHKQYIGDGCYVSFDGQVFELTTENGISVTNRIFLEPHVIDALLLFRDKMFGVMPDD